MSQFTTSTELYDALLKQPTNDCFARFMTQRGHTDASLSSQNGLNFVHTKMTICFSNDKQRKIPCYIRNSGSELRFSVWGKEDCDRHTEYLDTTPQPYADRPLMGQCDFFIVLLNNHNNSGEVHNYTVLDIDSQEELFKLYQSGFPVFDTPFTLSTTKKLPHFYLKMDRPTSQLLGEKFGRDFDLISNYVFEKKSNKVYGPVDCDLPTIDWSTMAKYLDIPIDSFSVSQHWTDRRKGEVRRVNKVPAYCYTDHPDSHDWKVDVGSKRFKPEGEVIPYMTLVRILEVLPVDEYSTRAKWLCLTRATINMITPNSNASDYLRMLNMFYSKSSTFDCSWTEEMANVFISFLNDNSYKGIGADWFYNQVKEHSPETYTELAFSKHRDLDIRAFGKLDTSTAVKLFNDRVAFLDGNNNQFVEFNTSGNVFMFRKEAELMTAYRNLHCLAKITKYTPDGTPMEKVTKSKFIKLWLDHEDRKTYRGGVCFKPPPLSAPYNQFNLFTGFDIDRNTEFDDKISSMTKEELEHELKFILQHLRYLSGEDKTDECFAFNLRFFAHLLKYPAILPRVALVWTSVAGVGKNQWLNFHELIMGKQYYYSSANSKELLGDFNDSIRGKLLLNLNEFKKNTEFMEAIKELITEVIISTREKHKNTLRVENCSRVVITTNNRPQILEFKARRFQVMRCSPYPASDEMRYDQQYGKKLHDSITSLYIQKCWLHYCRTFVDVTEDYNFEINRVITDEYLLLRSRNIPMGLRFLRWWYVNTQTDNSTRTSKDMYQLFKLFKHTEGETSMWSSSEFVNELETYTIRFDTQSYLSANIQAVIRMPKGKKQKYFYLDRDRCKAFLDSENIDTSVFLEASTDEEDDDE